MRTADEIEDMVNRIPSDAAAGGASRWPAMTYEQGVDVALRWALGETDEDPMDD